MSIEEIIAALLVAHPSDFYKIRRYIAWVKYRRRIHNEFYLVVHWAGPSTPAASRQLEPPNRYHWI